MGATDSQIVASVTKTLTPVSPGNFQDMVRPKFSRGENHPPPWARWNAGI